jgi:Ca2+-binding EF-hand superfamily protein
VRDLLDSDTSERINVSTLTQLLNNLDSRIHLTDAAVSNIMEEIQYMSPDDNSRNEIDTDEFLFALVINNLAPLITECLSSKAASGF